MKLLPRFDFHIHTCCSKDSPMKPIKIIKVAKMKGLEGIAVTDHNTIQGGLDVAKYADSNFKVIIGSEIITKTCEIIGLFLKNEIRSNDPLEVIDKIKKQDGLSILPHPFRSNSLFQKPLNLNLIRIAEKVDAIEVFNARTPTASNEKARLLKLKLNKSMVAGSDAHFYNEIGNATTLLPIFKNEKELKTNILEGKTTVEIRKNSFVHVLPFRFLSFIYGHTNKIRTNRVQS